MEAVPTTRSTREKRRRTPEELTELAARLGADWRKGDRVQTWLNQHEGEARELSTLVKRGWSWADLGQAMHLAGITFRTGEPISGEILRRKASHARVAIRDRQDRAQASTPARPSLSQNSSTTSVPRGPAPNAETATARGMEADLPRAWEVEPREPAAPMFRPVSLKGGRTLAPTQRQEPEMKTPPEGERPSDDEIIARLFKTKTRS